MSCSEAGQAVCPYHYEAIEEEWLLVLAGTPTVRTLAGDDVVATGDVVAFPRGRPAPTRSPTPRRARPRADRRRARRVAASFYEDSEKVGVFTPIYRGLFRRGDARDYWDGEGGGPIDPRLPAGVAQSVRAAES